ncbi:hypothetical protein [Herbidospora sp. NBRC 101105]|uniref:hypothetical protein n=1 Tax=Herbidospora sp. NBRC 101105 TaxID=3032195 RepID=UPI0024A44C62|nr:hypothetical protein [Herbidospora sp. NBRC 101105]GLX95883.1 hypothetical protein Hesp01_38330 [Herbidospora sp. NBRC 101105]
MRFGEIRAKTPEAAQLAEKLRGFAQESRFATSKEIGKAMRPSLDPQRISELLAGHPFPEWATVQSFCAACFQNDKEGVTRAIGAIKPIWEKAKLSQYELRSVETGPPIESDNIGAVADVAENKILRRIHKKRTFAYVFIVLVVVISGGIYAINSTTGPVTLRVIGEPYPNSQENSGNGVIWTWKALSSQSLSGPWKINLFADGDFDRLGGLIERKSCQHPTDQVTWWGPSENGVIVSRTLTVEQPSVDLSQFPLPSVHGRQIYIELSPSADNPTPSDVEHFKHTTCDVVWRNPHAIDD